ncbi:EF-hand domain-containing protein D2 isoform X1 [Pipra filicauda]|uniref:EF-hand domain-containing protein D2 isoform X1 n=1 Tax=Pipra filicauda TaxID=649802 RepID=A0A6J2HWK4_9PASS|nr:EF-hand domain-containing protein D2 isoform X1 [Pipra filicauda]
MERALGALCGRRGGSGTPGSMEMVQAKAYLRHASTLHPVWHRGGSASASRVVSLGHDRGDGGSGKDGGSDPRNPRYDAGKDGFIDLMELKLMMEKLGAPQTHLGLKNMIKEVDEDLDSKLSFREFLLIFRKAAAGELQEDSGLHALARLSEIDVSTEGVKGAKNFFEAKAQAINEASRFEEEIRAEQEEKKKQAEELKQRKAAFKELQSTFTQ